MKSLTCLLLVTSFAAGATEEKSYSDRIDVDSAGNRIVVRSSAMPDARGGTRYVEQRLDQVDATTYVYDPSIQTEATQKYHEEFCAQHGMKPSLDGESIISGAVSGWGCHLPRNENEQIDEGSTVIDGVVGKSSDYVFTTAPSGSVPVGNFLAYGRAQARSSVAGPLSATVSADNGRCQYHQTWHYGGAFTDDRHVWVNCTSETPRFISTRMEACVPRQCGHATGTISVR